MLQLPPLLNRRSHLIKVLNLTVMTNTVMFQRSHVTFGAFVSAATFPGTLWVMTKNSD
jgi:hypothetical protein